MTSPTLYHYTCDHGHAALGQSGLLRPTYQLTTDPRTRLYDGARFVWLTDLHEPDADGLGLTMHTIRCDRTVHRYRVVQRVNSVVPWSEERARFDPAQRKQLEAPPATPEHWWVSRHPIAAVYDPRPGETA